MALKGKDHPNWTGDNIKYISLHNWVKTHLGSAIKCSKCDRKSPDYIIDWASKSHKAKRDLDDYIQLCRRCHGIYDSGYRNPKKYKNNKSGCSGIDFHKKTNKWRARHFIGKKMFHIGTYLTKEEAIKAREEYINNLP